MEVSKIDWKRFQEEIGYSDEELALFRANPKAVKLLERSEEMAKWDIVAEVMTADGCSHHRVGDRIILSPLGVLRTREGPEKVCLQALAPLPLAVAVIQERLVNGLDPEPTLFDRLGCCDVGVECGGWGHVCLKIYPVRRGEGKAE